MLSDTLLIRKNELPRYKYIPEEIFKIYATLLKKNYVAVVSKSLLSEGSYVVNIKSLKWGVAYLYNRSVLHPVQDGPVRF